MEYYTEIQMNMDDFLVNVSKHIFNGGDDFDVNILSFYLIEDRSMIAKFMLNLITNAVKSCGYMICCNITDKQLTLRFETGSFRGVTDILNQYGVL